MEPRQLSRQIGIRELRLHRRRSRTTWIYLLYHCVPDEFDDQLFDRYEFHRDTEARREAAGPDEGFPNLQFGIRLR